MKKCCTCKQEKPLDSFHKDKTSKDGHTYRCKECATFHSKAHHARRMKEDVGYRKAKRASWIKEAHGLTLQEYEEKLIAQGSKCAICGKGLTPTGHRTHLDHDHKTGQLRDFLCTNCNRGIGHFQENLDFLYFAIEYLKSHRRIDTTAKEVTHQ